MIILLFPLLFIAGFQIPAGGETQPAMKSTGALEWKTFGQAIMDAKSSRKKILVDVYTTWCGWCKKMDRDTYADTGIMEYLRRNFELVKLNAEASTEHVLDGKPVTEKEIAKMYGITGYPTTVFIDPSGNVITVLPGYMPAEAFLTVLEFIGEDHYKTTSWGAFQQARQSKYP